MKILITSGGTKVPIDSVRHIGNMSSGRFGSELAYQFINKGHEVLYFGAKGSIFPSGIYPLIEDKELSKLICETAYTTYESYKNELCSIISRWDELDVVISAAAVSDYTVKPFDGKISSDGEVTLTLIPVEKVLPLIKKIKPDVKLVGFKLVVGETFEKMQELANKQIKSAGCDMVAANDLNDIRAGNRKYMLFYPNGDYAILNGYKNIGDLAEGFVREVINLF